MRKGSAKTIGIVMAVMMAALIPLLASSQTFTTIDVSKDTLRVSQKVKINIDGRVDNHRLLISNGQSTYRYLGKLEHNLTFTPREPGKYRVELKSKTNMVLDKGEFTVKPPIRINKGWLDLRSSQGMKEARAYVRDPATGERTRDNFTEGRYTAEVFPRGHVRKMEVHGLEIHSQDIDLGYEDVNPAKESIRGPKRWLKAYAIDPTSINFTNATVSSVAEGDELWKCEEYNFSTQTCYGEWNLVKNITPGQTYTFTLTPKDPIFAESTHDADDCYEPFDSTFCTASEVDLINSSDGNGKEFNKQSEPLIISYQNESQLIDTVQECTVYIEGRDSDGNTWTVELGNWSTQTFDPGSESKTAPNPGTISFNCTPHFGTNDDETLYDDFAIRISTNDGGRPATANIDYSYTVINFTVQDNTPPNWSNPTAAPSSPTTYSPGKDYQFNTTWTDNDQIDTVLIEHNFTGTLQNYTITGNSGNEYFYNYTDIGAGNYAWRQIATDPAGNENSTPYQNYTVTKSNSTVNLLLNGTDGNLTINNSGIVNVTGILVEGQGDIELYREGGLLQSGPSPQTNLSSFNSPGTYEILVNYTGSQNYTGSNEIHHVIVQDTIPPNGVTDLDETATGESWIRWNWTNPDDSDFNHSEVWVNGTFKDNTSDSFYNVTSLSADTLYEVQIRTVDDDGNVNQTFVNDTARTEASADTTPPTISNVQNTSITDGSTNITWDTDEDSDSKVFYGTIPESYTQSETDGTQVKNHSIILTGLDPSTTYYYVINSTDAAGNTNQSGEFNFTTLTDQTPPKWSGPSESPSDPATYSPGQEYQFNVTWTDNGVIDTVLIEHNFTGILQNSTVTNTSGDIYTYNINDLAAGSYVWKEYANDTEDNQNATDQFTYTINRASSTVNLLLNGTDGNLTINESNDVNITGFLVEGQGNITLRRNGSLITEGISPLTKIESFNAPGTFEIQVQYSGNENYTSSSETHYVNVNDTVIPNVSLVSPENNTEDPDGDVTFSYTVNDTSDVDTCDLIINGAINDSDDSITRETIQTFTVNNMENGQYNWSVQCEDPANHTGISSTYNLTVNIQEFFPEIPPVECSDPDGFCNVSNINESDTNWEDHGTLAAEGTQDVYMNFSNQTIPAGSTIHFMNITHDKYQEAGTGEGDLTIQWKNTSNGQWTTICTEEYNQSGVQVHDPVYCNFTESGNGLPTRTQVNDGLQVRSRFFFSGTANSRQFGTEFSEITVKYTEDTTAPNVELNNPSDETFHRVGTVTFEYTPSDQNLVSCSLYGDFNGSFQENQTDADPENEQVNNFTLDLEEGFYTWNVQCEDVANNTAFAPNNFTLNITNPDIQAKVEWISLSKNESDLIEGEQVTVSSIIKNRGNVNVTDSFTVKFFEGDPAVDGTQINGDQTISQLGVDENKTVNVTWTVSGPGPRNIFVHADTPLSSDGTIEETDETNNEANNTFDVTAYSTSYGNLTGRWMLGDVQNRTLINFSLNENSTGNIFVSETGLNPDFTNMEAISRDTGGTFQGEDFTEIDQAMNMTNFKDNINATWTENGNPIATQSFNVFGTDIQNVPIINSTNTDNFVTGILWDTSDGNTEYNGTQDIVFVTKINQNKQGKFGTYDYEIKYPRRLSEYKESSKDTVTFYYEIK